MNVTCTGCPAKYAIPDEKVRGRKVRITCKHCGTNIIVDGNALLADPNSAEPVQADPAPTSYIVGFSDDRQETHTVAEIVALYRSAKLGEHAVLWTDGMPDWLPPFEVPEVAEAMRKAGVARRVASPLSNTDDEELDSIARSAPDQNITEPASVPRPPLELAVPREARPAAPFNLAAESSPVAATPAMPVAVAQPLSTKSAARRAKSRSDAVDLFGGVSHAGSEADESLDFGSPEEDDHKLTGARNESSVLFSLDALTKGEPKSLGQNKARDRAREKEASDALFGDAAADALLNMGGGGFQTLEAPDFTRPVTIAPEPQVRPSEPVEVPNSADRKRGAPLWLVAVLGLAAAAGGVFFVMQQKTDRERAAASAMPEIKAVAPAVPPAAPSAAPAASTALEAPRARASAEPSPAESVARAVTATGHKPAPTAPATNAAPAAPATPAVPEKPAESKAPEDEPATPPPATEGVAFDKGAAVSALGAAAADAVSCKTPEGPTGSGKVSVTFAPSGRATMTNVGGAFAGTDVGGCVARLFRAARVPAFSGDPVTVSKSFTIQ